MENASKALIIAGAILLAIVIISLGLVVVNNSRHVTDNANLSEQEIQSFNAKFTAYEGKNVSGSRVNSLIQQVISSNQDLLDQGKATLGANAVFVQIAFPSISKENDPNNYLFIGGLKAKSDTDKTPVIASKASNNFTYNDSNNLGSWANLSSSASVKTGKNYTVKIEKYEKGLVRFISVTANS